MLTESLQAQGSETYYFYHDSYDRRQSPNICSSSSQESLYVSRRYSEMTQQDSILNDDEKTVFRSIDASNRPSNVTFVHCVNSELTSFSTKNSIHNATRGKICSPLPQYGIQPLKSFEHTGLSPTSHYLNEVTVSRQELSSYETQPLQYDSELTQKIEEIRVDESATIKVVRNDLHNLTTTYGSSGRYSCVETRHLDRSSVHGNFTLHSHMSSDLSETSPPDIYQYSLTGAQMQEMEQLRWDFQQQVFRRYYELEQKEEQWGTIIPRDNGIYFKPGKRREAILAEKKYHDEKYKEVIRSGGDLAWYNRRLEDFTKLYQDFLKEEAKHKQEMMLNFQERNSPFSKFPILGNRFILIRLLGKGGNGEVWDVIDYVDNKRRCALKISNSYHHSRREHLTHSRLEHENIVKVGRSTFCIAHNQKIYSAFTVDSVETDLQRLIEMYGNFDEESAMKILYQLSNVLIYLHTQVGISHYDLKPANILINKHHCLKLTDFDLARSTKAPAVSCEEGTLKYLPPECFVRKYPEHSCTAEKADIWMVGVIFCSMLWGKHPIYPEKTSLDNMKRIVEGYNGDVDFLNHPQVSMLSQHIIRGCLQPDPSSRPSALQLFQVLSSQFRSTA